MVDTKYSKSRDKRERETYRSMKNVYKKGLLLINTGYKLYLSKCCEAQEFIQ